MARDCNNPPDSNDDKEHRCGCGQLMAIQTPDGLEIKCKRCKQVYRIAPSDIIVKK